MIKRVRFFFIKQNSISNVSSFWFLLFSSIYLFFSFFFPHCYKKNVFNWISTHPVQLRPIPYPQARFYEKHNAPLKRVCFFVMIITYVSIIALQKKLIFFLIKNCKVATKGHISYIMHINSCDNDSI